MRQIGTDCFNGGHNRIILGMICLEEEASDDKPHWCIWQGWFDRKVGLPYHWYWRIIVTPLRPCSLLGYVFSVFHLIIFYHFALVPGNVPFPHHASSIQNAYYLTIFSVGSKISKIGQNISQRSSLCSNLSLFISLCFLSFFFLSIKNV